MGFNLGFKGLMAAVPSLAEEYKVVASTEKKGRGGACNSHTH